MGAFFISLNTDRKGEDGTSLPHLEVISAVEGKDRRAAALGANQ